MRPPLLFLAFSALLLGACYSPGDGEAPPLQSLYFPTGLALDFVPNPELPTDPSATQDPAKHLYVASSDFDLQYRSSALAAYDLDVLASDTPRNCNTDADCAGTDAPVCDTAEAHLNSGTVQTPVYWPSYFCVAGPTADAPVITPCKGASGYDPGVHSNADLVLYPGRCNSINTADSAVKNLITSTVGIGAFATDVVFKPTGAGGDPANAGRLFLPVRGDATLHWIDVTSDATLKCGQQNTSDNSCDDAHRIGDDETTESDNNLRQEPEPFAIALDDAGENIAVTNQTNVSVSLYVNHWEDPVDPIKLVYLLPALPAAPVGIAALPTPKVLDDSYEPGFLAVYRGVPQVDLLRVHADSAAQSTTSYDVQVLTRSASVGINANSNGSDSRGIAVDRSARDSDYQKCIPSTCLALNGSQLLSCACPGGDDSCRATLQTCLQEASQPGVFVSNRAPSSVLIGELGPSSAYTSGSSELPAFSDSIALSLGPSRVVLGKVRVADPLGKSSDDSGPYSLEQRVFIVCFDSRKIYIYDPVRHVIDSIVPTGRGPYALVIDEQRALGYVAHFTDSYLGVISLDQRFPRNYASIIASVGVPSAPRASK